mmetsp:Transcript_97775/g.276732  ORF Transcript_97775/g.276732 Transcript_97775/m.276732 type:complete len:235 (-) Transcript_97775:687-1391(-)
MCWGLCSACSARPAGEGAAGLGGGSMSKDILLPLKSSTSAPQPIADSSRIEEQSSCSRGPAALAAAGTGKGAAGAGAAEELLGAQPGSNAGCGGECRGDCRGEPRLTGDTQPASQGGGPSDRWCQNWRPLGPTWLTQSSDWSPGPMTRLDVASMEVVLGVTICTAWVSACGALGASRSQAVQSAAALASWTHLTGSSIHCLSGRATRSTKGRIRSSADLSSTCGSTLTPNVSVT